MTPALTTLLVLLNLLACVHPSHAMMEEVHMTDEPDIEMGVVVTPPSIYITQPRPATACCIAKHVALSTVTAACTVGIILTKDIPVVPILIGLADATILGLKVHQMYQDAKNIPGNKALHSLFSSNLQEHFSANSQTTHEKTIPFEVIESFNYALQRQHKNHLTELLYDTTILPTPPKITQADLKDRKRRFFTLLLALKHHKIIVPKDMKLAFFAYASELIFNNTLFQLVLPYAGQANFIKMTQNCPIAWFNSRYHAIDDEKKREEFANNTAFIMTEAEMGLKLRLIASSGKFLARPINKEALTNYLLQNYKSSITAPRL